MRRIRWLPLLLSVGVLLAPGAATAHARSVSYSVWDLLPEGARVRVRIAELELTRLALNPARLRDPALTGAYLASRLRLVVDGTPCSMEGAPVPLHTDAGWASFEWHLRCPGADSRTLESSILLEVAPSHMHFARIRNSGEGLVERVLTESAPTWELPGPRSPSGPGARGTPLSGYVELGIEHILTGWDHLAFVLALLLLAGTLGEVAMLVTAFTLAHSVTLALGVLGVLHPAAGAIEALIGFSIALVAAENGWILGRRRAWLPAAVGVGLLALAALAASGRGAVPSSTLVGLALFSVCHFALLGRVERPARLRIAVAFCFGLIHGFGFAGLLAEVGLPVERRLAALFGFNLGVELGQLAVVGLVWPLLRALASVAGGRWHRLFSEVGSAAVCGLGLFWFATRLFG